MEDNQNRLCEVILRHYDPQLLEYFKSEMSCGIQRFFLLSYCLACCWPGFGAKNNLRVLRQWPELEFVFPNEHAREKAIATKAYVPGNSVPIDVDVNHRKGGLQSRIFITNPRFDIGRPITLGTVDQTGKINAYPDYSWHDDQGKNCEGFTSVFRISIDECNRLWVLDAGKIGDTEYCKPQLFAFDLDTDEVVFRHIFNESKYISTSLFVTPIVDIRPQSPGDCKNTFVYIADVTGFAIVVVDVANNRSWRITHRLFFPFPSRGTFTIDGESFDLMDGILGMALSPLYPGTDRYLYFHALASATENVVRTSVIRNDSFIQNPVADARAMSVFPDERPNQSAAEAMDRDGILYFGLMDPPSIWCWNSATDFSRRNFHQLAVDQETLQFASGIKIINNLKGEQELWVLTSSLQRLMAGTLSSNRVNFRIHAESVNKLLQGSPCKSVVRERSHDYHANLIVPTDFVEFSSKYGHVSYL